ncbi:MAG: bifunctional 4-hydroxy-2-oxoglutarate aldolase/2-dehydro-3-deoxy-phosphogluconate aldolase [Alicyclobacillus herbarius]|uniref:bifunctional 4-hydroxy-2-oxoglutarate aldolase/2-dehydro-3-deoxy-phosphogluconate aldolase n=1 Tax=Alicyclobacillus herbarius TaxID=122960 RepID=UPI0023544D74|nr:bifunctional 4-hydroxy-2-oxoglutarate aldolase/2-dehydro-3-deoxy-phosphogluconate aldolase [Alicyclobacillus herbarius]MCL6633638.1 bifunctional 4-hydroxy-2-oxoglutarate aldolase/2-dehydro-3-deoxy-phosphogluconate aldolase [Alicyclobacillus herbarius]
MTAETTGRLLERIGQAGVVAVLRRLPVDAVQRVVEALLEGGVQAVELTMDSPAAAEVIAGVRNYVGDKLLIGAGTVMHEEQMREALDAGADFLVSPHFDADLVQAAKKYKCLYIPGIFTASEAAAALRAGAEVLKLFPAGAVGPGYLKDLLGPFRGTLFMPTGGIQPEQVGTYLAAGALAVGVGSALTPKDAIAQGDYSVIREKAETVAGQVREARRG